MLDGCINLHIITTAYKCPLYIMLWSIHAHMLHICDSYICVCT